MRKNLSLLFIFFTLLGITFYLEEVRKPADEGQRIAKQKLIQDLEKLDSIELPNAILNGSETWVVKNLNYPASEKLLGSLFNTLRSLETINELEREKIDDVFKQTSLKIILHFGEESEIFELGDVSQISGHFYVQWRNNVFSVEDTSSYQDVYSSDLDLNLKKYLRLKKLIELSPHDLIEKRLFKDIENKEIKFAKIDSKRNRWYSLDFQKNSMTPPPFEGLVLKPLENLFRYNLSKVRIKSILTTKQNLLTNLVSELDIGLEDPIRAKVFMANNGSYGRYVRFSNQQRIFEIEEEGSEVFFQSHQHYWSKRFVLPPELFNSDSFKFALSLDQKSFYNFKVTDVDSFTIVAQDSAIRTSNKNLLNFTFNLLLNATVFKEADYITHDVKLSEFLKRGAALTVRMFNKSFHILLTDKIEVLDEKLNLIYHFKDLSDEVTPKAYQRIFTLKAI